MPFLGGAYGGYIGMTGNWAYWQGCSGQEHFIAYSSANAAQAHTNFVTYHKGIGRGAYWFMGGPGVDPHWNGTAAEAYKWGAQQAARALIDIANGRGIDYPVVWMDIETTRHRARHRQRLEHRVHLAVQREGEAAAHPGEHGPGGLQRLLRLRHRALEVPAGCLLRRRGVELGLRRQQRQPGQPRLHRGHRRVDLRAGDHELQGQLPDRLLPEVGRRARSSSAASPGRAATPSCGSGPAAAG